MTNKAISTLLKEGATLIELTGGNPFRARALGKAARTLRGLEPSAADLLAAGTLTDVPGIGKGVASQVHEILDRGSYALRDELLAAVPAGVRALLGLKGLGVKRVRQLWAELGITSLDDLEAAAASGRLASLEGFGPKLIDQIQTHLPLLRRYRSRWRYADALGLVQPLLGDLRALPGIARVELTGPMRRRLETVDSADLLAAPSTQDARQRLLQRLDAAPAADRDGVWEATGPDDLPLRLYLADPGAFGTAWWRTTASDGHLDTWHAAFGELPPAFATEEALFEASGVPVIPPELREGHGEVEAARAGTLPDLVVLDDLHGCLHNHSTYSDGVHTLEAMAEGTRALGYGYFGICDHSQSLTIAQGLSVDAVRQQQAEIRQLNERYAAEGLDFRILSGTESDILSDGSLDYPDDVLASFDLVVASVHVGLDMDEQTATERVLAAVRNPYTTILGHPTGRLLLAREGYPLAMEAIIEACAEHDVAIELNANPHRLDVDWRWIRAATEAGVQIAINPDAHSLAGLEDVRWGVEVARKGWLTADQCLNAKPRSAFETWLQDRVAARVS